MLQSQYISDKKISKSLTKLNRISSDNKFRVKSLRVKTQQKVSSQAQSPVKRTANLPSIMKLGFNNSQRVFSPYKNTRSIKQDFSEILINSKLRVKTSLLQKDYQNQLIEKFHIPRIVIQQIFRLKLQYQKTKPSQEKYNQFCKALYTRLNDKVELNMEGFNLRNKALERFLQFFMQWKERDIIAIDLSLCSQLAYEIKTKQQSDEQLMNSNKRINTRQSTNQQPLWPKNSILTKLIVQDHRLSKLSVRNMHISPDQMVDLLTQCLRSKRIFSLDVSNKSSQTINRIGTDYYYLQAFCAKNQYIGVLKMDNLNITDQCIDRMAFGMGKNLNGNPLKILSLAGNLLTEKSLNPIYGIMTKNSITELNLSNNPLGRQFFMQIKNLRASTVKSLDFSSTSMDSQSLIHFLEQLLQNKSLQILKLDNNNYKHHWFNKTGQVIQRGLSVQSLSFANCSIQNFDNLMEGVTHSRNLKRLNLNYNLVDLDNQDIQKVADCLKNNKVLQQLRIRFCGYKESTLCRLIQQMKHNHTIEVFDISENDMSDQGGKFIIKMLSQNKGIKQMGVQKLQFSVRMTQEIQKYINFNRQAREKQQFSQLIDQNRICKAKDMISWEEISKMQEQAKRLQKLVADSKARNQKIQQKVQTKKQMFLELRKQSRIKQKQLDKQIKQQQSKVDTLIRKSNEQIQKVYQKQQQSIEALQIQQNLIKALQNKIKKQNQKIRKRQHQLQEQLRDQKYLQKKKQKMQKQQKKQTPKQQNDKTIKKKNSGQLFDNTKGSAILSKRRSSTLQQKKASISKDNR